ncbi:hypothetical protein COV18_05690 [Candidatus Woesearchaeota archaeon CG10_big_fil_rev_8_21_14_0_10_37_12]|nr:MAG: hypothetical protein COV18_05690 [Candidatus Woesearchaeota archaeon CG10_big_fil_rev_8_21_14_0_10_37_12]
MDKLDWKILEVIDWDARLPINQIAKKVKSNKDVVAYRIKKLQDAKIIKRYFPVLDMFKLGYHTLRLYLDLEELDEKEEQKIVDFLDRELNLGIIFRMDYPYRYGFVIWLKSIYDMEKIILKVKRNLGSTLIKYQHTIFSTFRQYPKDYLFNKKYHDKQLSLEPTEEEHYDDQDFLILKELAENARCSTVQISQKLKIPQTTVSNKIKALEKKKFILGYRADIDFIKLGFTNYFLEIYLDTNDNLNEIESWADAHPNVVWLQKIIGTCDIEIEVEVKGREELEKLLNELRHKFKNIRKIIFWSQEYKKLTFLP